MRGAGPGTDQDKRQRRKRHHCPAQGSGHLAHTIGQRRSLHAPYSPGQMTYDLRRLRLAGLIRRIEHTNRYVLTPDGLKVAIFYTKLHNRLLRPLLAADQPQTPAELRSALRTINQHIDDYITRARLSRAA
jgi:DNA-binding PadR family transcriptional regulator